MTPGRHEPVTGGATPLNVATLYPRSVAAADLPAVLADRPVVVRSAYFADSAAARMAKAAGAPPETQRAAETPLTAEVREALSEAEVVLALDLPSDIGQLAPRLRWVQACGAGVGQLIEVLPTDRVRLTTAAGVAAPAIAEFVLARLLQAVRNLREIDARQLRQEWKAAPSGTLRGRTALIVGLGAIGSEVARLAHAHGMRIIGIRRHPERTPADTGVQAVHGPDDLLRLLPTADVVVLSAAATAETTGLIGAPELAAMKESAVLVNVARGSLVDEDALITALRRGAIAAAVLDVTATEPLPRGHPLWHLDNVYLSPHSSPAGGDYEHRLWPLFGDNLRRYVEGRPLRNLVDTAVGY